MNIATETLYSKIQPGTVWRSKLYNSITFAIQRIDPVNKIAWGLCSIAPDEINNISFEYLVDSYNLQNEASNTSLV